MKQDMIVILDLGSTENTKLARDIREMGVYSEIYPHDITASELKELPNVKGIIINGGPNNVVDGTPIDVRSTARRPVSVPYIAGMRLTAPRFSVPLYLIHVRPRPTGI